MVLFLLYHLTKGPRNQASVLSSPAFTGTRNPSCVPAPLIPSFFLPARPTHLHEREGDGKRNILLRWPNIALSQSEIETIKIIPAFLLLNPGNETVIFVTSRINAVNVSMGLICSDTEPENPQVNIVKITPYYGTPELSYGTCFYYIGWLCHYI